MRAFWQECVENLKGPENSSYAQFVQLMSHYQLKHIYLEIILWSISRLLNMGDAISVTGWCSEKKLIRKNKNPQLLKKALSQLKDYPWGFSKHFWAAVVAATWKEVKSLKMVLFTNNVFKMGPEECLVFVIVFFIWNSLKVRLNSHS